MKKLFLALILLVFLTGCGVSSNPIPGIDKLISCSSCTVQVTRFEDSDNYSQWRGVYYICTIKDNNCTCEKSGDSGWMHSSAGENTIQPYTLPDYMSSCGLK